MGFSSYLFDFLNLRNICTKHTTVSGSLTLSFRIHNKLEVDGLLFLDEKQLKMTNSLGQEARGAS